MENKNRAEAFRKNDEVEEILRLLAENIAPVEEKLAASSSSSPFPTIFIFGCARSGTTVLHQYLINNIYSVYPSNFISRFFYAPYIGGLYYKLFTELDSRGELLGNDKIANKTFTSDLGKTEGVHSPNEFWYFWREHFPLNVNGTIDTARIDSNAAIRFRNSIYALQNLYEAPFITKGMIASNCIDYLAELFPDAVFIFIKRDLFANAKSLYNARLRYFNTPDKWYSFSPKNLSEYASCAPEEQVVRQVIDTNKEIDDSLERISGDSVIRLGYEAFCGEPHVVLEKLKYLANGIRVVDDPGPSEFPISHASQTCGEMDQPLQKVIDALQPQK